MNATPTFNLNASNINFTSDEELQKKLAEKTGNYFDTPGQVDLVISAAELHPNKTTKDVYCAKDPTWFNVKLTLKSSDGKEINHWLQVPTTKLEFGEKNTLFVFNKLQEFLIGLGEIVTIAKIQGLLEKYFVKLDKLVGQKVNVTLGYEGPYVTKADDSEEFVVMVKGHPMKDEGAEVRLPDRSSAVTYAKSQNIEPSFLRVLKFTAKKPVRAAKAATTDW